MEEKRDRSCYDCLHMKIWPHVKVRHKWNADDENRLGCRCKVGAEKYKKGEISYDRYMHYCWAHVREYKGMVRMAKQCSWYVSMDKEDI